MVICDHCLIWDTSWKHEVKKQEDLLVDLIKNTDRFDQNTELSLVENEMVKGSTLRRGFDRSETR